MSSTKLMMTFLRKSTLPEKARRFLQGQAETVERIIAQRRDKKFLSKRYKQACRATPPSEIQPEPIKRRLRPLPIIDRPVKPNRHNERLMQRHAAYHEMEAARAANFLNPQDGSPPGFSSGKFPRPRRGATRPPTRDFTSCPQCGSPVLTRRLAEHLRAKCPNR